MYWHVDAVASILDQYQYCGHTVANRRKKVSYKSSRMVDTPPEEWIITRNTHEAIIDEDTWQKAHEIREAGRIHMRTNPDHGPLRGKLFCSECCQPLSFGRCRPIASGYFQCKNHDVYHTCGNHRISRPDAEQVVTLYSKRLMALVANHEQELASLLEKRYGSKGDGSKVQKELKKATGRLNEFDSIINQLYEDKVCGKLTSERFSRMLDSYEAEQAKLRESVTALQEALKKLNEESAGVNRFLRTVQEIGSVENLSADLVAALIDKIIVGERRTENGEVQQDIRIVFNFVGDLGEIGWPQKIA